jgi:hypothetical protein
MKTNLKEQVETRESFRPAGAEQRLKERGIKLPAPPEPFGTYVEAVQTGNLLFLSGMLPTEGHAAKLLQQWLKFIGGFYDNNNSLSSNNEGGADY